ncbi:MAG: hypothetical protein H7Z40_18160 [Phycisphaerae bacterium]|nr:hypothetical protein [Gemmatimonadaceae bacterium]
MTLTAQQQHTVKLFPEALRQLVHDELACGNSIVDIGHGFPAPPAGAYIALANIVSTRPRDSDSALSFRARNSAISSGEFTDDGRFYFVIEPPSPPGPEPDMDVIRREHQSREDALVTPAQQLQRVERVDAARASSIDRDVPVTHSPSGVEYVLRFHDTRSPQDIQYALERTVRVLFTVALEDGQLFMRAQARVNGAAYVLTLKFFDATRNSNTYVLRVAVSWTDNRPEDSAYFRRTSRAWFELWTKDLGGATAPRGDESSAERYRALTDAALRAEAHLDSVTALQHAVVAGLKRGGTYVQSHKEGGTEIASRRGSFVRTDHGDNPAVLQYTDDTSFLRALRKFCHWDIVLHAATDHVSEIDAWRLILRRMETG